MHDRFPLSPMKTPLLSAALLALWGLAASASADTLNPDPADSGLTSKGEIVDTAYGCRIGELYSPGGEAYIIPFQLPKLPAGKVFDTAKLRFQLLALAPGGKPANADLYGIPGVRADPKPLPADYYQGKDPDPKAVLLQAAFLTADSKVRSDGATGPFIEANADAQAALVKFLNDAYANGDNAGKFVFLRISYAVKDIPDGDCAYTILTADAGADEEKPLLTYTFK